MPNGSTRWFRHIAASARLVTIIIALAADSPPMNAMKGRMRCSPESVMPST